MAQLHSIARSDPPAPLGHKAVGGFVWLFLKTFATKAVNFGGQIVLAWLLLPEHFGLIGLTYTVSIFVNILHQAGLREVLIRRQARFHLWRNIAFWLSLAQGLIGGLLMAAVAPLAARFYGEPELTGLILVMAIAAPLSTLSIVPLTHLENQLRFRLIAIIGFVFAVGLMGQSILFAACGAGAYSFALPWPIALAVRLVALFVLARSPVRLDLQFRRWRHLLGDSIVLVAGRVFNTLIGLGGYFMLGWLHTKEVVGTYYFGFNLSMQTLILFAFNLEGVLFPTLSKLQDDPVRQRQGYLNAARLLALLGIPACLLQAALADPVMHVVFQPKWAPAIPVVQVLSVGMAFRLVGWSSQSLIQAQGRFFTYLLLNFIGSMAFLTLSGFAAFIATPPMAALAVAVAATLYLTMEGPLNLFIAIRPVGGTWRDLVQVYAVPLLAGLAAAAAAMIFTNMLPPMPGRNVLRIVLGAAVALAIYLSLIRWLAGDTVHLLLSRIQGVFTRRRRRAQFAEPDLQASADSPSRA